VPKVRLQVGLPPEDECKGILQQSTVAEPDANDTIAALFRRAKR
jgi:hypothetical protein